MANENRHSAALEQMARELKNARVKRNMNVEEVSKLVKIHQNHIEKLEEGNFSFLPPIYVFAYIKGYARELGIENEELLEQCRNDLQIPNEPLLKTEIQKEEQDDSQDSGFEKRIFGLSDSRGGIDPKIIMYGAGAVVILLILFFLLRGLFSAPPDGNPASGQMPADSVSETNPDSVSLPPAVTGTDSSAVKNDSLSIKDSDSGKEWMKGVSFRPDPGSPYKKVLIIRVLDAATWVKVIADNGEKEYPGTEFKPGEIHRFEAKQKLWVNIGRPPDVELYLNGEKVPPLSGRTHVFGE